MAFDPLTLNAGTGGSSLATDTFTDTDAVSKVMPYGAVAFGDLEGPYTPVTATAGLPVQQQTGHTFAVSLAATSDFNLKQYGGSAVGATNALHVQPGTGAVFACSLSSVPSHDVTNAGTFAVQAAQSGAWNITNVSGTVTLPTGAATAAKQPALGTAGTASADVITVQGIASMTALKVDGSAVTQPVSGSVTANAGTNLNTSLLALESGGNLATLAGAVTSSKVQANTAQINGVAPSMGNGVSGTGVQRVTIASDSTGQVALAAGSATIGALTANQTVDVAKVNGTATDTNSGNKSAGTLRVVLATDQPQLTNKLLVTPDANSAVNVAQLAGNTISSGNGTAGTGTVRVSVASDSTGQIKLTDGSNTAAVTTSTSNNALAVQDQPSTAGGLTFGGVPVSAATNNKTQIKGSAGQLYFISAQNLNASPRYLKVFNNTSAGVTMGTTACDFQFLIPGNTAGAGVVLNVDKGIAMGTGITIAITGGIGTTDNTSISANEVTVVVGYK